jgi:hypothetical protein
MGILLSKHGVMYQCRLIVAHRTCVCKWKVLEIDGIVIHTKNREAELL